MYFTIRYNGNGKKVGLHKQLDGTLSMDTTNYMYNGTTSDVMKEYGPKGQPLAEYYWANSQVNSRKMFGFHGDKTSGWPGNIRTRGGLLYYNYDATGNVLGVDDRVGDTVMNYRYDAFGNLFTDMPAPYNATGYTGKNYDPAAGLMDYSARWYSPTIGRFLTEDTVIGDLSNPQSLNRYAYVMNNPVNMVDPSGRVPEWVRNQEDYSLQYDQGGTTYVELWNYIAGSYQKQTSPTSLVETIQTDKFYKQTYQQTITESWEYDYKKYFGEFGKILIEETQTFSETNVLEWYNVITAKELMEQNAGEIASYGAPPNARVVYSSSTLDGLPFTYDMIYGQN
ncbi:hypothetical protein BACCIP111895_02282 [Neobacillus rhizosphaerae]|uniref:RHS repeat-associated core domain-containing protein n=1 Tax=Neobacillus rhizosphaerae TaxID=2880965 RepID=A0ABM9ER66_9BACI|nr:RHS repeat-associated core domain-containing protein [Neobacillus rhizosphaerae]CAH2715098.1 hypothetical protein BACCIP111895_02282 [Neobacillus rhizosphaerae]